MAVKSKKWPESALKEYRLRVSDAVEQTRLSIDAIHKVLVSNPPNEIGTYIVRLGALAEFNGLRGIVSVVDRGADDWHLLSQSLAYSLAVTKVLAARNFYRTTGVDTVTACCLFLASVSLDVSAVRFWLGKLIIDSFAKKKLLPEVGCDPVTALSLLLANELQGKPITVVPKSLELPDFYDSLLKAASPNDAQLVVNEIALAREKLTRDRYITYPPFQAPPFDLFPVDLMAIAKVRFPKHTFTYGVLESPLCHPPEPFPFTKDLLVEQVMERCRVLMPVPDVDWVA